MQSFLALAAPVVGIGGAAGWAAALVIFDVRQRRLPDFLTVPAAALALGWIGFTWQWHALWGLLWPVLYLAMAVLSNGQGMGGGDIKLAVSLGVVIVKQSGFFALLTAIGLTAVISLVWGLILRQKAVQEIGDYVNPPNGPAMLFASALVIFAPLFTPL